jgi:hypothetical protein
MSLTHSTGLSNFALDSGIGTAFDGGTGRINVYTGSPPSAGAAVGGKASPANEIATGTLLGTLTLSSDAFAAAASGAIAINAVTSDTSADATGTAGYAVIYRTGDTALTSRANATDRRLMGTVGTSGADFTIDVAAVITGGTLAMSGWSYVSPA